VEYVVWEEIGNNIGSTTREFAEKPVIVAALRVKYVVIEMVPVTVEPFEIFAIVYPAGQRREGGQAAGDQDYLAGVAGILARQKNVRSPGLKGVDYNEPGF
jgi:hypothetical protein